MRKEWFEEVDGGASRFSNAYNKSVSALIAKRISYAFRTLLAEDQAALELVTAVDAPLSVDDVPTLTDWQKLEDALSQSRALVRRLEGELRSIDAVLDRRPALDKPTRRENIEHAIFTASKADSLQAQLDAANADLAAIRAEVQRHGERIAELHGAANDYCAQRESLQAKLDAANAELAAYRARVEAGKVVITDDFLSGGASVHWVEEAPNKKTTKTALLIDEAAIAPAVEQVPMFTRHIGKMTGFHTPDTRRTADRRQS